MFVCVRISRVRGIMKLNSRILRERTAWREKGQGGNISINRRDEEIRPLSHFYSSSCRIAASPQKKFQWPRVSFY